MRTYPCIPDEIFRVRKQHLRDIHVSVLACDLQSCAFMGVSNVNVSSVGYQKLHVLGETVVDSQKEGCFTFLHICTHTRVACYDRSSEAVIDARGRDLIYIVAVVHVGASREQDVEGGGVNASIRRAVLHGVALDLCRLGKTFG